MIGTANSRMFDPSPVVRLYARHRVSRLNSLNVSESQQRLLLSLVNKARNTAFGKAHRFSEIRDVMSYSRNVPLRRYEDFWRDWWRPDFPVLINVSWPGRIPFFAMSSGTSTGQSKYIPYTRKMRWAAAKVFVDLLCFHIASHPNSSLLGGAALALTGPTDLEQQQNQVQSGAVSAITFGAVPAFLRRRILPPPDIAQIADWNEKIVRLAEIAPMRDVRFFGGSPNWLLIFFEEVARQHGGDRLIDWFPDLELVVHGGINFAPYRDRFAVLLNGSQAETREMYSASEGVFAIADRADSGGMRLMADASVFFEFVPIGEMNAASPTRHWIGTVEPSRDYAVAISTASGLWSYFVGDIVRFVDVDPPRLVVVGRIDNSLSIFGEHLIEAEIADAVSSAGRETGLSVNDYCVGAEHGQTGGYHLYLIEVSGGRGPGDEEIFAKAIDARLQALNADYRDLRDGNTALEAPVARLTRPGGFLDWMQLRRKLGGQNKVPHIVTEKELFKDIESVVCRRHGARAS